MIYILRLPRALWICTLTTGYLLLCGAALLVTSFYFALTSASHAEMHERLDARARAREYEGRR